MAAPGDRLSITAQSYALTLRIDRQALNGPAGWRESCLLSGSQWATPWTLRVNQMGRCVALNYGEICRRDPAITDLSRWAMALTFERP